MSKALAFINHYLPELRLTVAYDEFSRFTQSAPALTPLAGGGFALAWRDVTTFSGSVTQSVGLGAATFDALGNATSRFTADATAGQFLDRNGFEASLATLSNGQWVAGWDRTFSDRAGGSHVSTMVAGYGPNGAVAFTPAVVSGVNYSFGGGPVTAQVVVAPLPAERFLVVWDEWDRSTSVPTHRVLGQTFTATGQALGARFVAEVDDVRLTPFTTPLSADDVLVGWAALEGSAHVVRGQIYDDGGQPLGAELELAAGASSARAAAHHLTGDRFVLAWEVAGASGSEVRAQIFDRAGQKLGAEIAVNAATAGDQLDPAIELLADGSFVVAWTDRSGVGGDTSGSGVKLRHFDAFGAALGGEILANTFTGGDQSDPALAALAGGRLLVSWTDMSTGRSEVHGQLFDVEARPRSFMHSDVDRDGAGDLVWTHGGGTAAFWTLEGGKISLASAIGPAMPEWTAAASADFDGDRLADLAWRRSTGEVAVWELNGAQVVRAVGVGQMDAGWSIAVAADFQRDGEADLLWRHDSGFVALWEMNDSAVTRAVAVGQMDPSWRFGGTADLDRDGDLDILWRHSSGAVAAWQMNGGAVERAAGVGFMAPEWTLAGLGDLDADGSADFAWRHVSGAVAAWDMDGLALAREYLIGNMDPAWRPAGLVDAAGDGAADLAWRHANGAVALWEIENGALARAVGLGQMDSGWSLVA